MTLTDLDLCDRAPRHITALKLKLRCKIFLRKPRRVPQAKELLIINIKDSN